MSNTHHHSFKKMSWQLKQTIIFAPHKYTKLVCNFSIITMLGISGKCIYYTCTWPCCYTQTFQISHFKLYDILKCKILLFGFLDELGNFKQKKITIQNLNFFYISQQWTPYINLMLKQLLLHKNILYLIKTNCHCHWSYSNYCFNNNT